MTNIRKLPAVCTPEIYELVIDSLHQGITVAKLLMDNENNPEFPARGTIMKYINADNARKQNYARAREDCADSLAEQVITEADSTITDPARAANRMKARQFLASKLKPKVYGDKLDIDMTGRIDVATAITAARERARLEPLTIDNDLPMIELAPDPFS